jgi:hypothetical protein
MLPRHTGQVGCSTPASGFLDEKAIIGVSPGLPIIGGLECRSELAVNERVYCSAENRYGSATLGTLMDASRSRTACRLPTEYAAAPISRGRCDDAKSPVSKRNNRLRVRSTQTSGAPSCGTYPRPARVEAASQDSPRRVGNCAIRKTKKRHLFVLNVTTFLAPLDGRNARPGVLWKLVTRDPALATKES